MLFKQEDNYYKPVRVCNFCNNSHIENEWNGDRGKKIINRGIS